MEAKKQVEIKFLCLKSTVKISFKICLNPLRIVTGWKWKCLFPKIKKDSNFMETDVIVDFLITKNEISHSLLSVEI